MVFRSNGISCAVNKLVIFMAPQGVVSFCSRLVFFLTLTGALNFLRDHLEHGPNADGFLNNLMEATFVGLPFMIFALLMVGHLARLQRQLLDLAATDILTGLPNRRAFLDDIAEGATLKRAGTFLMVDLDHFKRINDTFGHTVGDMCLKAVGDLLHVEAKDAAAVARLGGEEFGLYVPGPKADAVRLATVLAAGLIVNLDALPPVHITMSIGLATGHSGGEVKQVMSRADVALYAAKHAGRAQFVSWSDGLGMAGLQQAG